MEYHRMEQRQSRPSSFRRPSKFWLIGAMLLSGCASHLDLDRFYTPSALGATVKPRDAPPQLVNSNDPDRDGRVLEQDGYNLLGTTLFNGDADLPYAARAVLAQGRKVGAGIVVLKARPYSIPAICCAGDGSLQVMTSNGGTSYFASYWVRAEATESAARQ